jgi:hypothetical protein
MERSRSTGSRSTEEKGKEMLVYHRRSVQEREAAQARRSVQEREAAQSRRSVQEREVAQARNLMTHKYRGSRQSSREVKPKFIDSTQGEPKNICKP